MLPLKDDIPTRTTPYVTVALIAVNILVFLYQASLQLSADPLGARAAQQLVFEFGLIPCRLIGSCMLQLDGPSPTLTVFSSMFLHGGLFHLFGNMLYLWIFGNNIEDTLGHGRFLLFYFAAGVVAALAQTMVNPDSRIPMIGASGAVSGVLGAYLLLFPRATVHTLLMFGFFIRIVRVPAMVVLGFWVVVQAINALGTFGNEGGGVAFMAHLGGFVAGLLLIWALRPRSRRSWA